MLWSLFQLDRLFVHVVIFCLKLNGTEVVFCFLSFITDKCQNVKGEEISVTIRS